VPKTDTEEREKILTRQFLLIKRVQAHNHTSGADTQHKMAKSGSIYISDTVVPAPYLGFVQVKDSEAFLIG
jgi:hypothetical protein